MICKLKTLVQISLYQQCSPGPCTFDQIWHPGSNRQKKLKYLPLFVFGRLGNIRSAIPPRNEDASIHYRGNNSELDGSCMHKHITYGFREELQWPFLQCQRASQQVKRGRCWRRRDALYSGLCVSRLWKVMDVLQIKK